MARRTEYHDRAKSSKHLRKASMQNNLMEPTNLPSLPAPGFIELRILESPIPLALTCIAVGVLVFATLRHSTHAKRIGRPAILLGLITGIGIYLTGHFIITDREHLETHSNRLVEAVIAGDTQSLNQLLSEKIEVKSSFFKVTNKDRVISQITSRGTTALDSATVRDVNTGILGSQMARTQIKVRVKGDMIPPLSWWSVDWTRSSPDTDQWIATHIEALWIQGFSNP